MVSPRSSLPALIGVTLAGEPWSWEDAQIVVGGFEMASLPGCELWRKLIEGDVRDRAVVTTVMIAPSWSAAARKSLAAVVPPSRYPHVVMATDANAALRSFLNPPSPISAFALLLQDPVVAIAGAPNDPSWETFAAALTRLWPPE